MKRLYAALWTESLKIRRAPVLWVALGLFAFIGIMMGFLVLVSLHPEYAGKSSVVTTKASFVKQADWVGYFDLLNQVILSLGVIGFGFITSWVFGREFSDRTAKDLLALPVSRPVIISAKFIVVMLACMVLACVEIVCALLVGLLVSIPGWSPGIIGHGLHMFFVSAVLTLLAGTPVAFIASAGRGYLPAIGYAILTIIITQLIFAGLPGIVSYVPWAVPALASGIGGSDLPKAGTVSYIILAGTCLAGYFATLAWWRFADQT